MSEKPFNKSIIQVTQNGKNTELDASTQIAIKNVLAQLTGLRDQIAALQVNQNIPHDQYGVTTSFNGIRQTIAQLVNTTGAALRQGIVLVPGAADCVTLPSVENDEHVIGVAFGDGVTFKVSATALGFKSTVADILSVAPVCQRGVAKVRCVTDTTPIAIGDYLKAAATLGYATRATATEAGVFAVALQTLSALKSGLVTADINPKTGYDNAADLQPFVFKPTYDLTGVTTGISGAPTLGEWFREAAMSTRIKTETYHYSGQKLVSVILSVFDVSGAQLSTLQKAIEYTSDNISKIIQEIA